MADNAVIIGSNNPSCPTVAFSSEYVEQAIA